MKMKEIGPEGARVPSTLLDLQMHTVSSYKIQRRRHQMSKTGVSVVPQK